jgi:hypothetical protein
MTQSLGVVLDCRSRRTDIFPRVSFARTNNNEREHRSKRSFNGDDFPATLAFQIASDGVDQFELPNSIPSFQSVRYCRWLAALPCSCSAAFISGRACLWRGNDHKIDN